MPTPERPNPPLSGIRFSTLTFRLACIFTGSFALLILLGTALLMVPGMITETANISLLNALFTATSAATSTGLTTVNVATSFTFQGQLVLLFLIQLGGIGIVASSAIGATLLRNGTAVNPPLHALTSTHVWHLLWRVTWLILLIEITACIGIFMTWGNEVQFESLSQKLFYSFFHAIAAFCNAGFSLFPEGFYALPLRNAYVLHIVVACIVILGSLGFSPIMDIFSPVALRKRLADPSKDWKLGSKLAIYLSMALIIAGMAGYYLLERNNTLDSLNLTEAMITCFFQSATTRTAGFATIKSSQLLSPTLVMMLLLMFIGASPGSTGGGIKTTTFFLMIAAVMHVLRGKTPTAIKKRTFSPALCAKAMLIVVCAAGYCLLAFILLYSTEPGQKGINLLFEQVSAFANAGLSTGITSNLSLTGKVILIFSMFVGRVGILLLVWLLNVSRYNNHPSTDEDVLLG